MANSARTYWLLYLFFWLLFLIVFRSQPFNADFRRPLRDDTSLRFFS